jgi:hypothetical protein
MSVDALGGQEMHEMISNLTDAIDRRRVKASADNWLSLAAAPTFAIMALLAGIRGGSMPDMLCSPAPDASLLTGMVPMYMLMSVFHLGPWLRVLSHRRSGAGRS